MEVRKFALAALPYVIAAAVLVTLLVSFRPVRVAGRSMHPVLHTGDLVFVSTASDARLGAIVLTQVPGRMPVLHRVIARLPDGSFRTKGDANVVPDIDTVRPDNVAGRVVAVVPVGAIVERWRQR